MEESGENWPSDFDLEAGDDVKDFNFEDGELVCGDDHDEGHSISETGDPMVRKTHRKGERTDRLWLALSATIPGLKKMDDTSILDEASNYVKQLQKRVRELEQQGGSNICSSSKGTTTTCEVNSDDYHGTNDILPEVNARVSQNEVLVIIHCERQKGIMLKMLSQLENLHLSVVNSSELQFGKSTLVIIIIAKMDDTSILDEASNYVKQLQKCVRELEQQVGSNICSSSKGTTTTCEVNSDDYHGTNDILLEVNARVSQNEFLVIIHCERQKGIMLKILSQLENLHLSIVKSSELRFGKSTLVITIIVKMGDGYNITVDELVKTLTIAISTQ